MNSKTNKGELQFYQEAYITANSWSVKCIRKIFHGTTASANILAGMRGCKLLEDTTVQMYKLMQQFHATFYD